MYKIFCRKNTVYFFFSPLLIIILLFTSCENTQKRQIASEPFSGDLMQYELVLRRGRDRDWEEDVLEFAMNLINNHPLLLRNRITYSVNSFRRGFDYDPIWELRARDYSRDKEFYEPFSSKIKEILWKIPILDDYEIYYGLAEASSILSDLHTRITYPTVKIFPFQFSTFSDGIFTRRVLISDERALGAELIAINYVPVAKIVQIMGSIFPVENEYVLSRWAPWSLINKSEALLYTGIINSTADIPFTFLDTYGEEFTFFSDILVHGAEEDTDRFLVNYDLSSPIEANYWFEYFPESDMIHVRFNSSYDIEGYPFTQFSDEVFHVIRENNGIETLVFDVRGNMGGLILSGVRQFISNLIDEREIIGSILVLIDENTYSAGVITAGFLKKYVDDVILIGIPTSHGPNFFAGIHTFTLPNSGISYTVSTRFNESWPGFEGYNLMPDIYVPNTIDKNHFQAIMEVITSQVLRK
ncbi:MAG: S41 family peptidase [Treponema sp.]|nr:S41 family peptidase [Treponema sp.]